MNQLLATIKPKRGQQDYRLLVDSIDAALFPAADVFVTRTSGRRRRRGGCQAGRRVSQVSHAQFTEIQQRLSRSGGIQVLNPSNDRLSCSGIMTSNLRRRSTIEFAAFPPGNRLAS
jgi:hypothetical protein